MAFFPCYIILPVLPTSSSSTLSTISHRYNIILLYLVIVICVHGIDCFQRFSEQPKYTEVNPGQDALLTCKVIDKRGTCSWQKDNKPVGIYAKKYEWAARPSSGSSGLHLDLHPPPMQIGGDCSLWIRSATLDFDDGLWECQVTASDFTTQDALTSQPVRLVVRVAPQRPRLEFEGAHVPPGHNISIDSSALATVKCVSHYGNPPATLKWYLGDQEIAPIHPQTNTTEPDNSRTWSATSVVQITAMRERHGDILRCLAFHESYTAKSVPVEARMDIKYAPTIRLIGSPEIDLEEDKDALILRCVADANPPASIVWRRAGRSEIASLQETLQLRPVGRRDAGLYTCQAQNSIGASEQLSVQLDVKYPPKILSAGPDRLTTAPLFSPAAFECVADGNPMPAYKWVQRLLHGSKYIERGHEARLVIDNVTYDYQGEYECRATSYINGQERVAISEPVSLQVVGAPQVLRLHPSMHTISVKRGEPASLTLVVCADPRPHRVAWEWGSLRLDAGSAIDRFHADDVIQDSREDCYLSTLHIQHTDEHDSRPYYLVVENERGSDRHAIHLNVEEPLEMSYLLGIAGGCLAAILILICLCIYAVRSKKCCFKGSSGYKSSDKDSEKADLKSRSDSTSGPQGDSIYTTPAGFHHQHHHHQQQHPGHGSPEAMKFSTTKPLSTTTTTTAIIDYPVEDFGNLLWQTEAAEFIAKYPQRRRRPHGTLQQSSSAGTLYKKPSDIATSINKRASGGELLPSQQRHQRDRFSGDLGIPEIHTHVGSVVHNFETMALQRQQAERAAATALTSPEYQPKKLKQQHQQQSRYQSTTPKIRYSSTTSANISRPSLHGTRNNKYYQLKRKSHESRLNVIQQQQLSLNSYDHDDGSNNRHKLTLPTKLTNSCSTQTLLTTSTIMPNMTNLNPTNKLSTTSLYQQSENNNDTTASIAKQYGNIQEDYRKNLFGTTTSRSNFLLTQQQQQHCNNDSNATWSQNNQNNNSPQSSSGGGGVNEDEAIIVNAAFDEIFAGYSGIEDDDDNSGGEENMVVSLSELDDEVFKAASSSNINILGRPGSTPKKFTPLLMRKKAPPPKPPTTRNSHTDIGIFSTPSTQSLSLSQKTTDPIVRKRQILPLSLQKHRSTTLANLFDRRLKSTQTKSKRPLSKISSDSLLKHDQLDINSNSSGIGGGALHKYPPQLDLYRKVEGEEEVSGISKRFEDCGNAKSVMDFLRGSTLSHSFVCHSKMPKTKKPPAPAPPPVQLITNPVISERKSTSTLDCSTKPLRYHMHLPTTQRSKSSNELFIEFNKRSSSNCFDETKEKNTTINDHLRVLNHDDSAEI